jgi:hypothetical protein
MLIVLTFKCGWGYFQTLDHKTEEGLIQSSIGPVPQAKGLSMPDVRVAAKKKRDGLSKVLFF